MINDDLLRKRSPEERRAYLQGFEYCLDLVVNMGVTDVQGILDIQKELGLWDIDGCQDQQV